MLASLRLAASSSLFSLFPSARSHSITRCLAVSTSPCPSAPAPPVAAAVVAAEPAVLPPLPSAVERARRRYHEPAVAGPALHPPASHRRQLDSIVTDPPQRLQGAHDPAASSPASSALPARRPPDSTVPVTVSLATHRPPASPHCSAFQAFASQCCVRYVGLSVPSITALPRP
jgi:hypothetical protein